MVLTARIDDARTRGDAPARGTAAPASVEQLVALGKAVGDALRAGVLQVLHEDSYSVTELCELFQVPQPALSHHLKILHGAGLLAKRREGNSIFYRRASPADGGLQRALFAALDQTRLPLDVSQRIRAIHAARRRRSEEFFAQNAKDIASEQAQICESAVYTETISDLISELLDAGLPAEHALEVGPGDGHLLRWLAGTFDRVTGLDSSEHMLEAARAGTRGVANLRLSHRDFHAQADQRRYQLIVAAMVVHHQASPSGFFQKAAKMLKPGGALIVAELCSHDQQWASDACGDLWLGFDPADLAQWAETAGLLCTHSQYLAQKNGFRIQVQCYRLPAD